MKALSIKQPWAWLICAGMPIGMAKRVDNADGSHSLIPGDVVKVVYKDAENRNRPTKLRERIYIHASLKPDNDAQTWLMDKGFAPMTVLMLYSNRIPKGAIMGEVDIIDCVTGSESMWFTGPYGYVLANPALYGTPIPYKGKLGFFEVTL